MVAADPEDFKNVPQDIQFPRLRNTKISDSLTILDQRTRPTPRQQKHRGGSMQYKPREPHPLLVINEKSLELGGTHDPPLRFDPTYRKD